MKRNFKIVSIMLSIVLLLSSLSITSFAAEIEPETNYDDLVSPCYANVNSVSTNFIISSSGSANISVRYTGKSGNFQQAKVTAKIQKKVLLFFWNTVDIGEPNNEWVQYSSNLQDCLSKTFNLKKKGTYRAVITVDFFGSDGENDIVEQTIEYEYE